MKVYQIYTGSDLRNFSYLIEKVGGEYICVDPFDASQILAFLGDIQGKLVSIINTHEHFDHIQGNEELRQVSGAEICAHENARGKIPHVAHFLQKDQRLFLSDNSYLLVLDTPGHTLAHLCLLLVENNVPCGLFSGDTFFNAGVGNCHYGDVYLLYETVRTQIQSLPDEVLIYPGHEYLENNLLFSLDRAPQNSEAQKLLAKIKALPPVEKGQSYYINNMACERQVNSFLRLDDLEIRHRLGSDFKECSEKEVFVKLRKLRDHW